MKDGRKKWTEAELAILRNGQPTRKQAPLLPGKTIAAIQCKKKQLRLTPKYKRKMKEHAHCDAYKGQKVRLYQFITTKEATPDLVKQW